MGQNEILFYIMAAGCMVCLMIGIVKKPAYLLVLLVRGAFCSLIVYGVAAPVNLNFLSIGTGALLGLPGIVILYATAVLLFR